MIKYFATIILSFFVFGCSSSLIKINSARGLYTYPMFGESPERNFSVSKNIGDTLKLKWENDINGGFSSSSITAYSGYIFVNDLSGRVFCFNDSTGKEAGELKYKGAVFSAPVIDKSNLIFAVTSENDIRSNLISYNFLAGREVFNLEIKGKILTQITKVNNELIFNTESGTLFKYNTYGEEKWKVDLKSYVHSTPSVYKGIIFLGDDNGEIIALRLDDGKMMYRKKIGSPFFAGAAIRDGIAYVGNDNGKLYAVDLNSGNIKWEFSTGARILMIPAVKDDKIIIGNLHGDMYAIKKSDGSRIWKLGTGGLFNATPLITNNSIIVPDYNKKIYLVSPDNGKILKTYNLGGRLKLSPVIIDNTLFIGYEYGNIRAYEF